VKVLLTGAQGQLGCALRQTAPEGVTVEALGRADLDLTDTAEIHARILASRPDVLINAAAYTAVDKAESEEALAHAINADAVEAMIAALDETGGKLVHISTDFVFDGTASHAYRPDDARNPLSAYGRSKAAGEDALRPDDLLIRTAWVYAAGGANFVRTMLRLMCEREEIGVVADQIGAPTWASGLAEVIWALVEEGASGTFHHCDAGETSWHGFATAIQEEALALSLLDCAIPIRAITTGDYPTPAKRPAFSLLDCSKTRDLLKDGYTDWRANLRRMLEEEKKLG
jgi:dTDP-4-dehydrorhamnose reductase